MIKERCHGRAPAYFVPARASTGFLFETRKRLDEWGLKSVPIVKVPNLQHASLGSIPAMEIVVRVGAEEVDVCDAPLHVYDNREVKP